MSRSYANAYCPIARALDVLGERWALLIVRELLHGPMRYTDLQHRLETCSSSMLATRLKGLEADGVIERRVLPPPAASTVYRLTEQGEGLRSVLFSLAHWGLRAAGPPPAGASLEPGWLAHAIRVCVLPVAADARLHFCSGEEEISLVDGSLSEGHHPGCTASVSGSPREIYALFVEGDLGAVAIEGEPEDLERLVHRVLGASRLDDVPTVETVA